MVRSFQPIRTTKMANRRHSEGLKAARLLMVLSSISPLFILWGIRGNSLIPDRYFLTFCALMVVLPNIFLWMRVKTARKLQEKREIVVGAAEDHRDHLLVYLFAMLLPLYAIDFRAWRDVFGLIGFYCFSVLSPQPALYECSVCCLGLSGFHSLSAER